MTYYLLSSHHEAAFTAAATEHLAEGADLQPEVRENVLMQHHGLLDYTKRFSFCSACPLLLRLRRLPIEIGPGLT
eukprot:5640368-Amphidinium_carterae.1